MNGVTVINFARKATLLNEKFSKQCTILDNSSTLPAFPVFPAHNQIESFMFSSLDITELIHKLDCNKAHGSDGISIRMVKLCSKSISKPLFLIFKNCLTTVRFPKLWKIANFLPFH